MSQPRGGRASAHAWAPGGRTTWRRRVMRPGLRRGGNAGAAPAYTAVVASHLVRFSRRPHARTPRRRGRWSARRWSTSSPSARVAPAGTASTRGGRHADRPPLAARFGRAEREAGARGWPAPTPGARLARASHRPHRRGRRRPHETDLPGSSMYPQGRGASDELAARLWCAFGDIRGLHAVPVEGFCLFGLGRARPLHHPLARRAGAIVAAAPPGRPRVAPVHDPLRRRGGGLTDCAHAPTGGRAEARPRRRAAGQRTRLSARGSRPS